MKIVYLAAGAAGMMCGTCLHDNTLAAALSRLGEDILLAPTYTPLRTDEENVSAPYVLYGGLNVYLQQTSRIFNLLPRFVERLLDKPAVLNLLTHMSGSVKPEGLGALTVSMLRGEEGAQRKELQKLVEFLAREKPDIVHLSNAMLIGMAREIRRSTSARIVCSLSGEDIFLDKLRAPYRDQAQAVIRERAGDVDSFVALNRYYANHMVEYMDVAQNRVHVVPHGLDLTGHGDPLHSAERPFTIGYLARICHDKGLHQLVEAFVKLSSNTQLPPVRLRVAGYLGAGDKRYFREIEETIAAAGLTDRFEYLGEITRVEKIRFLREIDVFSVPTVYRESKGIYALEAMANGAPLVQPDHGVFPELIHDTQGGLLFRAGDVEDLAGMISRLIENRELGQELGRKGQAAIRDRYTDNIMARRTLDLYHQLQSGKAPVASTG